jgi:hypothetical protein
MFSASDAEALCCHSACNFDPLSRGIDAKMNARFAELGGTVLPGSPADFGKLLADENEKWGKVIRTANIKAE